MAPPSEKPILPDFSTWATALACPACYQPLRLAQDQIACTACDRIYPIIENIPVLIPDRTINPPTE
jgi:uncharacterized protein YbaR (Trm112 family)